jgi:hypothetical protein
MRLCRNTTLKKETNLDEIEFHFHNACGGLTAL